MKSFLGISFCSLLLICAFTIQAEAADSKIDLTGFVDLFDGKTLDGWQKLTSYNEFGKWEIIDGCIAGDQWPAGKGGLLVTKKKYSDYELYAEVKTTYPQDSGLFLRVQPDVLSYQITIDHRPTGEIGAVYVPGGGGFHQHCYEGFSHWHPNEFNTMRVRIEGQPPRIQVWIGETQITDHQSTLNKDGKPFVPESGVIGVQVHPGENWKKGSKVLFRKLMIKELK